MITATEINGQVYALSQDAFKKEKLVVESSLKYGQDSQTWIKNTSIYAFDDEKEDKKGQLLLTLEDHSFRKGLSSKQNKIACYNDFFVVSSRVQEITLTENHSASSYTAYDYTGKVLTQRPYSWNESKDKTAVSSLACENETESE